MRSCGRNDRGQMRRKFFRGRPLSESGILTAPHRDFPIAKRLLREPLDDVVPVTRLLREQLAFTGGISAAANIDQRKNVAVRSEICPARVVGVRDVGRKSKDDWRSR